MEPTDKTDSPPNPGGLQAEIHMLRGLIQRVMALVDEGHSLQEMLKLLDGLSMASTRLARLLQTDIQLSQKDDLVDVLNEALAELLEEMNHESAQS